MASFYHCYQNPLRFSFHILIWYSHWGFADKFAQKSKILKDSGRSGKMTLSCKWPIDSIIKSSLHFGQIVITFRTFMLQICPLFLRICLPEYVDMPFWGFSYSLTIIPSWEYFSLNFISYGWIVSYFVSWLSYVRPSSWGHMGTSLCHCWKILPICDFPIHFLIISDFFCHLYAPENWCLLSFSIM